MAFYFFFRQGRYSPIFKGRLDEIMAITRPLKRDKKISSPNQTAIEFRLGKSYIFKLTDIIASSQDTSHFVQGYIHGILL